MGAFIGIVDAANCVKIAQCDCVGAFVGIVEAANCVKIANVTVWVPS